MLFAVSHDSPPGHSVGDLRRLAHRGAHARRSIAHFCAHSPAEALQPVSRINSHLAINMQWLDKLLVR